MTTSPVHHHRAQRLFTTARLALILVCTLLAIGACTAAGESPASWSEGLSRAECRDYPGTIVGDPGDGSVLSPELRCSGGEVPIAEVVPSMGEPAATEGDVCCSTAEADDHDPVMDGFTRQECLDYPGVVVGDPGDGSIWAPGYRCAGGDRPLSEVVPLPGEPVATEGEVCCASSRQ